MSSWRFSSFFKGIWTAYFGWTLCSYSSRPQGRPRALFVALQWGLRPTHRPSGCAWQTRARPRDRIAGGGPVTGRGCRVTGPAMLPLTSICQVSVRSVLQTPLWEAVSSAQRNLELFLT